MNRIAGKAGRPTKYTEAVAREICWLLMGGDSLQHICEREEMPAKSTVFDWLAKREKFRRLYQEAREIQAELRFDEIIDIADSAHDKNSALAARVQIDARKWVCSKLLPKKYGKQIDQNVQIGVEDSLSKLLREIDGKCKLPVVHKPGGET